MSYLLGAWIRGCRCTAWISIFRFKRMPLASVAAPPALNFTPVNCARDIRIDLLRGYFFAIMTIAHMPEHPLSGAVRQTVGLVSVAEGFVFVSGLMFGMVYGRTLLRNGVAALRRRALKRAQDIYLNHAAVYTLVVFSAAYAGLDHRFAANFWGMWGRGLLMIYQPGLFFLLPMYFLFVLRVGADAQRPHAAGLVGQLSHMDGCPVRCWKATSAAFVVSPGTIQRFGVPDFIRCWNVFRLSTSNRPHRRSKFQIFTGGVGFNCGGVLCGSTRSVVDGHFAYLATRRYHDLEVQLSPAAAAEFRSRRLPDLVSTASSRSQNEPCGSLPRLGLYRKTFLAGLCLVSSDHLRSNDPAASLAATARRVASASRCCGLIQLGYSGLVAPAISDMGSRNSKLGGFSAGLRGNVFRLFTRDRANRSSVNRRSLNQAENRQQLKRQKKREAGSPPLLLALLKNQ